MGANNTVWVAEVGGSDPAQGSYTLVISSTGTEHNANDGKGYTGMHGTLDASLPAIDATGATGTVTLHGVF